MSRSGIIGFKNIVVGIFEGEGQPYKNITPILGAKTGKISVSEGAEPVYSDDALNTIVNSLESVELEIETLGLSTEEEALLLGETIVEGVLEHNVNNIGKRPFIGLAFVSECSDGSNLYVSIPKIKFSPSDFEATGKEDKAEISNRTLKGNAVTLDSGAYMIKANDKTAPAEFIANFLQTIPQAAPKASTPAPTKSK